MPGHVFKETGFYACEWSYNSWAEIDEEFAQTKKQAKDLVQWFYDKVGAAAMTGNVPHFPQSAWIFTKKNISNWRDKTEITGKDGEQLTLTALVAQVAAEKRAAEDDSEVDE